jgi:hypothetical protein|tara:strand:+ start:3291 stop:3677 length:387 start_codon:yes stop_codon:yes gene_type:complete
MKTKENDQLHEMFRLRRGFMSRIKEIHPSVYPEWPVDLSDKKSQQAIREVALKGVEEMFEALGHLKNWKPHRMTELKQFDKSKFLEEVVDAFNYFFSLLVLTGTSADDLFEAYCKKDNVIHQRLNEGY